MGDNTMSEPRLKFEIADKDLAFIKGLDTATFPVKIKAGEPYILHHTDHVIPIINHEDRWGYEHLYAVNVAIVSGYEGVYADSENEALNEYADFCAEQVPDPENEGQTKMRYPGLIQTWHDIVDEVGEAAFEDYSGDYDGPWGNESWYFTEHGHSATAKEVHDPKIPPIPDGLFPYTFEAESDLARKDAVELAFWYLRKQIGMEYGDREWAGFLEDYVYDNRETKFVSSVQRHAEPGIDLVIISVAE